MFKSFSKPAEHFLDQPRFRTLHLSASNRVHPTKFSTSFQQLSDGFSLHLASQNTKTVRCKVVNHRKANMTLENSASLSSRVLIGQFKWKPPRSCLKKDVTKLSKTNQKLCPVAAVRRA